MAVVGAVWFAAFALAASARGAPVSEPTVAPGVTLAWGLVAGALSVSANYLLIGSLRTIVAALIGVAFLGKPADAAKLAGFALATAALLHFAAGSGAPSAFLNAHGARLNAALGVPIPAAAPYSFRSSTPSSQALMGAMTALRVPGAKGSDRPASLRRPVNGRLPPKEQSFR